jgi:hypothetical protein
MLHFLHKEMKLQRLSSHKGKKKGSHKRRRHDEHHTATEAPPPILEIAGMRHVLSDSGVQGMLHKPPEQGFEQGHAADQDATVDELSFTGRGGDVALMPSVQVGAVVASSAHGSIVDACVDAVHGKHVQAPGGVTLAPALASSALPSRADVAADTAQEGAGCTSPSRVLTPGAACQLRVHGATVTVSIAELVQVLAIVN